MRYLKMFEYKITVLSDTSEGVFEIIGTSDKELQPKTLLEILLQSESYVCVQDEELKLGFYRHKYHQYCLSDIGHAM